MFKTMNDKINDKMEGQDLNKAGLVDEDLTCTVNNYWQLTYILLNVGHSVSNCYSNYPIHIKLTIL